MKQLANKVAIIIGASSGIGYAAAQLFAKEGAKLVIAARRKNELDELTGEIIENGGEAVAVPGDVRDEALARLLVETATEKFGGSISRSTMPGLWGSLARYPTCHRRTGAIRWTRT